MTPKILEYDGDRVKVTAEAYIISELKAIIDKYGDKAEPYLAYVHLMTAMDSPYINLSEDDKEVTIIYDITSTFGIFDYEDEVLKPALNKLATLFTSTTKNYYEALKVSIDQLATYLRTVPIIEGRDGNLSEIIRIHKEAASTIANFKSIEKQVDEELKVKTRGDQEVGEY